jgi:hypothetical protein
VGGVIATASSSIETIEVGTKITIAICVIQLLFWLFNLAENTYMTIKLRHQPTEACNSKFPHWKRRSQLFGLSVSIIAAGRNVMRLTMAGSVAFWWIMSGHHMYLMAIKW